MQLLPFAKVRRDSSCGVGDSGSIAEVEVVVEVGAAVAKVAAAVTVVVVVVVVVWWWWWS